LKFRFSELAKLNLPRCIPALLAVSVWVVPGAAHADKVFYKNGKIIDGLVQEEYPSRIKFLYQGRILIIPRDRIEKIVKETGGENVQALMDQFATAMRNGDLDQAQALFDKANELNGPSGAYAPEIKKMGDELRGRLAEGSAAERRERAKALLADAAARFDRIQNQKGLELLMQALEVDPTFNAAHEQMAAFMRENRPDLPVVIDYFSKYVDPADMITEHPVIERLPEVYVSLRQDLMNARDPEQIAERSEQLKKVSSAFEAHPEWAQTATSAEKMLIDMRADGIFAELVNQDLDNRRYDVAQTRLNAWSPPEASPAIAEFYVRTSIGAKNLAETKRLIDLTLQKFPDAAWAEKTTNAIGFYVQATEAAQASNHADARAILNRLFSLRGDLLPEIYSLVASQKVGYDLADLQAKEGAGDITGAADLAAQIYSYATEQESQDKALDVFQRLAPQMAYNLAFVWQVDGQEVPTRPETVAIVRNQLNTRFNLQFSETSPFVMTVRLIQSTARGTGIQLREAAAQPNAYQVDLFLGVEADNVIGMKIDTVVSHPVDPSLYARTQEILSIPQGATLGRDQGGGLFTFVTLNQHSDIEAFLNTDFGLYLSPEMATIGNNLNLPL
jgi:tetratricopeptide (TPR) repeat protein